MNTNSESLVMAIRKNPSAVIYVTILEFISHCIPEKSCLTIIIIMSNNHNLSMCILFEILHMG